MGFRCRSLLALLLCVAALALAEQRTPPRAFHAKTYPAREERPSEKMALAADPYDLPDKAAVFVGEYLEHGLMPVHIIISNDGDEPLSLADMQLELVTVRRVRIRPSDQAHLYRRLSSTRRPPDTLGRRPSPLPIPGRRGGPKPAMKREIVEELEQLMFRARAVEPRHTQHGFFFFDIEDIENPLAGARLYVSGIRDGQGQEMFFFEIPMEKYLGYQPPK
jgi:hypothetical protein